MSHTGREGAARVLSYHLHYAKVVRLHLLRYENIQDTKPIRENPMNIPKIGMDKYFIEILKLQKIENWNAYLRIE